MLIARLLQGFAVAGEFGSATAFLVEHSRERKGFFAAFQWFGQGLAAVLASLFGVILFGLLTPDQLNSWGWRLPFFFGLLIGPLGFYIRSQVGETPEFEATGPGARADPRSLRHALGPALDVHRHRRAVDELELHHPLYADLRHQGAAPAADARLHRHVGRRHSADDRRALFGHLSDKIGRLRMMVVVSILFALSPYPAFVLLVAHPWLAGIVGIVCWLSLLKAAYSGVLPALMSELFSDRDAQHRHRARLQYRRRSSAASRR